MERQSQIKFYQACDARRRCSQTTKPPQHRQTLWNCINRSKRILHHSVILLRSRFILLPKKAQKTAIKISKNDHKTSNQRNKIPPLTPLQSNPL